MLLKNEVTKFISRSGIARLARSMFNGRFVIALHGVASRRYPEIPFELQPSMSSDELRTVLTWLHGNFKFLTPYEFFNSDKAGVLLTFDDGLASNYHYALPLLEEFNSPAVFFVTVQHILDPFDWLGFHRRNLRRHWLDEAAVPSDIALDFYNGMTVEQLKFCANHPLITIGAHTMTHPSLPDCTADQIEQELCDSKRILADLTSQPIDLFAYPYGHYHALSAQIAESAGYKAAFVENSLHLNLSPMYEIPRIGIYWCDSHYLDVKLSGLFRRPLKAYGR